MARDVHACSLCGSPTTVFKVGLMKTVFVCSVCAVAELPKLSSRAAMAGVSPGQAARALREATRRLSQEFGLEALRVIQEAHKRAEA